MPVVAMKYIRQQSQDSAGLECRADEQQKSPVLVRIVGVEACAIIEFGTVDEMHRRVAARKGGGLQRESVLGVTDDER